MAGDRAAERIKVGGILRYRNLCMVGVMAAPDRPGLAAAIFRALGQQRLNAQFIVQSIDLNGDSHVQLCVAADDLDRVVRCLEPVAQQVSARKIQPSGAVALICVFGPDFRERPGIAALAFGALADAEINILAISTSISTISCVITEADYARAMEAWQGVFALP